LARPINPIVYKPAGWRKKRKAGNSFVVKVSKQPKVFLVGTEEALTGVR
jgi:hypothetical protein